MTINWEEEIIGPYNERYNTDYTNAAALISELRYNQNLTWKAIDKITGASIKTLKTELEMSPYYDPKKRLLPGSLRDKLLKITAKKLKNMGIHEIMEEVPGYEIGSYYEILRVDNLIYKKRRGGNTLKAKLLKIPAKKLKRLDLVAIKKMVPGYAGCSYYQTLKAIKYRYKKRKQR